MEDITWTNHQEQDYEIDIDIFTEFLLDIHIAFNQNYLSRILVATGPLFLSQIVILKKILIYKINHNNRIRFQIPTSRVSYMREITSVIIEVMCPAHA